MELTLFYSTTINFNGCPRIIFFSFVTDENDATLFENLNLTFQNLRTPYPEFPEQVSCHVSNLHFRVTSHIIHVYCCISNPNPKNQSYYDGRNDMCCNPLPGS